VRKFILFLKVLIVVLSLVLVWIMMFKIANASPKRFTTLQINNGYFLSVSTEIKCDFDPTTQRYKYHQFVNVRSKSKTYVDVPWGMKFCELWPKIKW